MASGKEINFFFNYIPPKPKEIWNKEWKETWSKRREFFSCNNSKNNYLNYMATGSPEGESEYLLNTLEQATPNVDEGRAKNYLEYMEDKQKTNLKAEKASGLFDRDGLMTRERRAEFAKGLQNTGGIIWEGVITFEKAFGQKYCSTIEQAQSGMKDVFKKFLDFTHLKDKNVNWSGSLHENTDHYHIHWTFYEKEPWRTIEVKQKEKGGKVNTIEKKIYASKGTVSKNSLDYLKSSFYKYFTEKAINVHTLRDQAIKKLKEIRQDLSQNGGYYKEFRELSRNLWDVTAQDKYETLVKDTRKLIDRFAIRIICSDPDLKKSYLDTFSKLSAAKKAQTDYAKKSGRYQLMSKEDSFREDLLKRMGNQILGCCRKTLDVERKGFDRIRKMEQNKAEFMSKKRLQANIRAVKKEISKTAYAMFREAYSSGETAEAVLKNYKWLELLEEEKENEYEKQKHQG